MDHSSDLQSDPETYSLPVTQRGKRRTGTLSTVASPRLVEPHWLESWSPGQTVPAKLTQIQAELSRFEVGMAPASAREITVELAPLISMFSRTLPRDWNAGASERQAGRGAALYLSLVQDLPFDLLAKAVRHALQHCEFFPLPGKLRGFVDDEFRERNRVLQRLRTAEMLASRQQRAAA